jgi:hypothetical protein
MNWQQMPVHDFTKIPSSEHSLPSRLQLIRARSHKFRALRVTQRISPQNKKQGGDTAYVFTLVIEITCAEE